MDGGEDPLERNLGALGDAVDGFGAALELAEHDLVLAQEERAEIPDSVGRQEGRNCLLDAAVERLQVGVLDARPEALGHVPLALRIHADDARRRRSAPKAGAPYEIAPVSRSSVRPSCARDEIPSFR